MRHIVFTPDRNQSGNDYVGAFDPESRRYANYWRSRGDEVLIYAVNPTLRATRRVIAMFSALEANQPVDRFVCFCHGWRTGIQMGLSTSTEDDRYNLDVFAKRLMQASTPELKVALYACSTGSSSGPPGDGGDGGFADLLRDALCRVGRPYVTVFAHTTAGHTTKNSAIRFFAGNGDPLGGYGGDNVVARKTAAFNKLTARLHGVSDDLRWRLPYMTPVEIHAELA